MSALGDAIDSTEFRTGLAWGCVALAPTLLVGAAWLRTKSRPAPVVGLGIAVATLLAVRSALVLPKDLTTGVILLLVGGIIADAFGRPTLLAMPLAVPGAVVTAQAVPANPSWVRAFVFVVIVIGGTLVASFDGRHARLGAAPALFTMAAAGVYVSVPDTEQVLVLLGVVIPLAFAAWPGVFTRLGTAGALGSVGVLAWAAAVGGVERPASIIGGVASLGLLVVEPVIRAARRFSGPSPRSASVFDRLPARPSSLVPIASLQAAVVFLTSRVAGLRGDVLLASVIAAITLALLFLLVFVATDRDLKRS